MDIEVFRRYCLSKRGTEETLPFGPDTLVYKVMGKAFALTGLDEPEFRVNLKCDPEQAIELRDQYPGQVLPGWHMNKRHWNTVLFEAGLPDDVLKALIDHSYDLVVAGLPAKTRIALSGDA
jgi:predicted DNA-binding protein (MmcQ/YjbR family)